jgi:hypothetical protein
MPRACRCRPLRGRRSLSKRDRLLLARATHLQGRLLRTPCTTRPHRTRQRKPCTRAWRVGMRLRDMRLRCLSTSQRHRRSPRSHGTRRSLQRTYRRGMRPSCPSTSRQHRIRPRQRRGRSWRLEGRCPEGMSRLFRHTSPRGRIHPRPQRDRPPWQALAHLRRRCSCRCMYRPHRRALRPDGRQRPRCRGPRASSAVRRSNNRFGRPRRGCQCCMPRRVCSCRGTCPCRCRSQRCRHCQC